MANTRENLYMVWTFSVSERMYRTLEDYADLMGQVGIFSFTCQTSGQVTGAVTSRMLDIVAMHPNVTWLLTIQNYNTQYAVIDALLNNTNGARTTFLSEIQRLINLYPWCGGIDIDFENCGGQENQAPMKALFEDIYRIVHTQNNLHMNICLPPITGPNASVGGEYWCSYADYANCADTTTLMSYAFAWLGSAPGPVSPDWWLESILEYATSVLPRNMILIGMGAWCLMWALHKEYAGYRATSGTYYWALFWLEGQYNFFDFRDGEGRDYDEDRQPYVPITGYYDEYNKIDYLLPGVYDYVNANMHDTTESLSYGSQSGRPYAVSFTKEWHIEGTYNTIYRPATSSGIVDMDTYVYASQTTAYWTYNYTPTTTGRHKVYLVVQFPWYNQNAVGVTFNGANVSINETRFWHIKFRNICYYLIYDGNLTAGTTYVTRCSVLDNKVAIPVYGIRAGSTANGFDIRLTGGIETYTSYLRPQIDVNKNEVYPAAGFAMTSEVLLSTPDSANILYDDFRSYTNQNALEQFYDVTGTCSISGSGSSTIVTSTSSNFKATLKNVEVADADLHIRFSANATASTEVGVVFGNIRCFYRGGLYSGVYLYQNDTELANYGISGISGLSMRVRENSIRIYSGTNTKTLLRTVNIDTSQGGTYIQVTHTVVSGDSLSRIAASYPSPTVTVQSIIDANIGRYPNISASYIQVGWVLIIPGEFEYVEGSPEIGFYSNLVGTQFSLFRWGSGWWYEPYEKVTMTITDQNNYSVSFTERPTRTNVSWDEDLEVFRVTSDINESATRSATFSLDYVFRHTNRITDSRLDMTGGPISLKIEHNDINVRHVRTYIGDADGFGIGYYEDADVIQNWYNRAIHEYGIRGLCMWSLGQEDWRIWERLRIRNIEE